MHGYNDKRWRLESLTDFTTLRVEIADREKALQGLRDQLDAAVRACPHVWGEVREAHIETPGFMTRGDTPGTMGVDWQGPQWIPPHTEYRWSQQCNRCGHVRYTKQTTQKVTNIPKFD